MVKSTPQAALPGGADPTRHLGRRVRGPRKVVFVVFLRKNDDFFWGNLEKYEKIVFFV